MPLGIFGIADDTVNLVVNLLLLFLVVVWFALIAWTYFDARRRIDDPVLVMCAMGASLIFPYLGTIVYSILRPPEFLDDRHERELEIRAAELRLRQLEEQSCPNCDYPTERTYLRCPRCRARIKHPCEACREPVDPRWSLCPYCETALRPPQPERLPAPGQQRQAGQPKRKAQPTHRQGPTRERAARKPVAGGDSRGKAATRPKQGSSRSAAPVPSRQGSPRGPGSSKGRPKRPGGEDGPREASAR